MSQETQPAGDAAAKKKCFVICPIGNEGTPTRAWSDDIFRELIEPITAEFNYESRRAIDAGRPGDITTAIISDIKHADLVVADLTEHNPNVFYELALAHTFLRPTILLMRKPAKAPFDITVVNVIEVSLGSFVGFKKAQEVFRSHVASIEAGANGGNPVTNFLERESLMANADPTAKRVVELEDQLSNVSNELAKLTEFVNSMSGILAAPPGVALDGLGAQKLLMPTYYTYPPGAQNFRNVYLQQQAYNNMSLHSAAEPLISDSTEAASQEPDEGTPS